MPEQHRSRVNYVVKNRCYWDSLTSDPGETRQAGPLW